MIEINDVGIVVSRRRFSDSSVIISCFTKDHGKISGIVRDKCKVILGDAIQLSLKKRLMEHLGKMQYETIASSTSIHSNECSIHCKTCQYKKLLALQAASEIVNMMFMENDRNHNLFFALEELFTSLQTDELDWIYYYVQFEIILLEAVGMGLNLKQCILTGTKDDLYYISPKSGCAVNKNAGMTWSEKLLKINHLMLSNKNDWTNWEKDLSSSMEVTEHFINKYITSVDAKMRLPYARQLMKNIL